MVGVGRKPKAGNTIHKDTIHTAVSSGGAQKQLRTVTLVLPDSYQQEYDTPSSPINAPQWLHTPCSGLSWSYRVNKCCL